MLLSGLGADGVSGLIRIKKAGGVSIVQERREAPFSTMPERAIADDDVDAVLPIDGIAAALVALAAGEAVPVPDRRDAATA